MEDLFYHLPPSYSTYYSLQNESCNLDNNSKIILFMFLCLLEISQERFPVWLKRSFLNRKKCIHNIEKFCCSRIVSDYCVHLSNVLKKKKGVWPLLNSWQIASVMMGNGGRASLQFYFFPPDFLIGTVHVAELPYIYPIFKTCSLIALSLSIFCLTRSAWSCSDGGHGNLS